MRCFSASRGVVFFKLILFYTVAVFRKMPDKASFKQVTIDMKSPCSIYPPTVNRVEYYFQYLKNEKLMGLKSDIVVVEL